MNTSRRQFFLSALGMVSVGLISSMARSEEKRRARPAEGDKGKAGETGDLAKPLVDPKDSAAQAMNYSEKKSDVKKPELKIERNGVAFDKQHCNNCGFYKEVGTKAGGKVGTCTIFNGKLVKSEAWCSSWNKKA